MHHFSVHWIAYADLKFASREHNSVSRQGSKSCCRPCFVFGWAQGLSRSALSRFWPLFLSLFGTLVATACSRLNLRTYFSFPQIWLSIETKIKLFNVKKNKLACFGCCSSSSFRKNFSLHAEQSDFFPTISGSLKSSLLLMLPRGLSNGA
jgi:hypothetical protein